MKKFIFLFAAVLFTAISSNLFAQGTGINPGVGEVKTYSVADHVGSTYTWTVTVAADGSGTNLLIAGTIVSGTSAVYTIDLTWSNLATGNIYYVHVVEDDGTCSNHKVLAVQPINQFEMDIANVDNAGAALANTFETCAPAVTNIAWNGADPVTALNANDFDYDYGTVTFYYKVTATGITGTDWDPVFVINETSTGTVTAEWATTVGGAYTSGLNTDGSVNTFTVTGSNEFFVKVIVANGIVDEGTTARDIEINLDETASADEHSNIVVSTNTDTIDQTITARPATGNIGY
ncbi:MAG: hypothetical protein HQ521_11330 [Bacteroidetes bacterium]|nr:hypothetical protein [Bacteroidota bacterium]